jgi:hypothetical protein
MTAVGRAVITRWLVDEVFSRCFHPCLEPGLSRHLKAIERSIRHVNTRTLNSVEEQDALTNKILSWRMATLEGLQDILRSSESQTHRSEFIQQASDGLKFCLFQHLADPPPPDVEGSVSSIVENVVAIACNLPMESRDVSITLPLPGDPIHSDFMEIEKTGLPALDRPVDGGEDSKSVDEAAKDGKGRGTNGAGGPEAKSRGGMLGSILSTVGAGGGTGGSAGNSAPSSRKGSVADPAAQQGAAGPFTQDANRIRFAGFVAVEVRGRQVLHKAPVWPIA